MSKLSENKDMIMVFAFLIIGIILAVLLGQLFHNEPISVIEKKQYTQEDSINAETIYENIWENSLPLSIRAND